MKKLSIEEQVEIIKSIMRRKEDFWSQAEADAKREARVFSWDCRPWKDQD